MAIEEKMTIEQKIDQIVKGHWPWGEEDSCIYWKWNGPGKLSIGSEIYHPETTIYTIKDIDVKLTYTLIHDTIINDDSTNCLTSRSEYIREYKKWLIQARKENL